jgi:hypothetical protein
MNVMYRGAYQLQTSLLAMTLPPPAIRWIGGTVRS